MSGLFGTFNILKRAMGATQYSINTTSHNIANANTEGYSRQRVTMEASKPFGNTSLNSSSGPGQVGTGVDIKEIERIRDTFLDKQIRDQLKKLGTYEAREEFLTNVEVIFMEPSENGISTAMGRMWDAWQEVASSPESSNARTALVEVSATLADQIRNTYNQLEGLQKDAGSLIQKQVFEAGTVVSQIQDLNRQIESVKLSGNNPNDLMDRRDLLVDGLSKMIDIDVAQPANGRKAELGVIEIKVDGETLVGAASNSLSYISEINKLESPSDPNKPYEMVYYVKGDATGEDTKRTLTLTQEQYDKIKDQKLVWTDDAGDVVVDIDGNIQTVSWKDESGNIKGGSIHGYASVSKEVGEYKEQLNAMTRAMAAAVNLVHKGGDLDSTTYGNFFSAEVGNPEVDGSDITAKNIRVNPDIYSNPQSINTEADLERAISDPDYNNGDRALAIARLRDVKIDISNFWGDKFDTSGISGTAYDDGTMSIENDKVGTSIDDYFEDIIGKLGSSTREAVGMVTNQEAMVNQLLTRKESISGVSMDEEMANLIQFQRSYTAAARMVTVIDELLQSVINLVR